MRRSLIGAAMKPLPPCPYFCKVLYSSQAEHLGRFHCMEGRPGLEQGSICRRPGRVGSPSMKAERFYDRRMTWHFR